MHEDHVANRWRDLMARPIARSTQMVAWLGSVLLFAAIVLAVSGGDLASNPESGIPTIAVARGDLPCAYPPGGAAVVAPLYPLLAGPIVALLDIGPAALGPHAGLCIDAGLADVQWAQAPRVPRELHAVGLLTFIVLLAGVVRFLRTTRAARTVAEAIGCVAVTIVPPIWMCFTEEFHAEDLLAVGLVLFAMAAHVERRWIRVGVLLALAVLAQQFALLALVVLVVVAPPRAWGRVTLAGLGTAALILIPLAALTEGRVLHAVGGQGFTGELGSTWVGMTHLGGTSLVVLSRGVPLVLSGVAGWAVARRFTVTPAVLSSLVALAFSLRLAFETNLYGYYFMAVATMAVVTAVVIRRAIVLMLGWLILVAVIFCPFPRHTFVTLGPTPTRVVDALLALATLVLVVVLLRCAVRQAASPQGDEVLVTPTTRCAAHNV